jgi:hypothetical protein
MVSWFTTVSLYGSVQPLLGTCCRRDSSADAGMAVSASVGGKWLWTALTIKDPMQAGTGWLPPRWYGTVLISGAFSCNL